MMILSHSTELISIHMVVKIFKAIIKLGALTFFIYRFATGSGDIYADKAMKAYEKEKYEKAINLLKKSLNRKRKEVSDTDIYNLLIVCAAEIDDTELIVEFIREAEFKNAMTASGYVILSRIYSKRSYPSSQIENILHKALHLDPNHALSYGQLGILYINKDLPKKAIEKLEKAIELDPNEVSFYTNLAIAYYKLDDLDSAMFYFDKAEPLDPEYVNKLKLMIS